MLVLVGEGLPDGGVVLEMCRLDFKSKQSFELGYVAWFVSSSDAPPLDAARHD